MLLAIPSDVRVPSRHLVLQQARYHLAMSTLPSHRSPTLLLGRCLLVQPFQLPLSVESSRVLAALRHIASAPGSKLAVGAAGALASGPAVDDAVVWTSLRDAVAWAASVRRVRNEVGPKVLGAGGARLRC